MIRGEAEDGFTLIEMMIALALFALISIAGYALIESILATQARTDGRLERLAALQRALFVITRDFEQMTPGEISAEPAGIGFRRKAPGGELLVRYDLVDGVVTRRIGRRAGDPGQRLIDRIAAVRLRYFFAGSGWRDDLPIPPRSGRLPWPEAASISLTLQAGADEPFRGTVERVVELPRLP